MEAIQLQPYDMLERLVLIDQSGSDSVASYIGATS